MYIVYLTNGNMMQLMLYKEIHETSSSMYHPPLPCPENKLQTK